jgi:hypothetical protein
LRREGLAAEHVEPAYPAVIQAAKVEAGIMRYALTDHEWTGIKSMPPNIRQSRADPRLPSGESDRRCWEQ